MLDGVFSFVLLDTRHGDRASSFMAARDAIGVTPLYIGWGIDGTDVSLFQLYVSQTVQLPM
jgi:asparagine synthase (glutamine-hydrolysing)